MAVRRAATADSDTVLSLVNELLMELGGQSIPSTRAQAAFGRLVADDQEGFILVYEKNNAIVGVCSVSLVQAIRSSGPYAIIQEMYVVPALRGRGIGATLVAEAVSQAALLGCSIVELGTPMDGDRQERFYERLGFQRVGSRLRKSL